jgi:hypothetical protein
MLVRVWWSDNTFECPYWRLSTSALTSTGRSGKWLIRQTKFHLKFWSVSQNDRWNSPICNIPAQCLFGQTNQPVIPFAFVRTSLKNHRQWIAEDSPISIISSTPLFFPGIGKMIDLSDQSTRWCYFFTSCSFDLILFY